MKTKKLGHAVALSLIIPMAFSSGFASAVTSSEPLQITTPDTYSNQSSNCMGNAGSAIATSTDGSRIILADASLFNNCDPSSPTTQKVWISSTAGATWVDAGLPASQWGPVASSANGQYLLAGSFGDPIADGGELWLSSNYGANWSKVFSASPEVSEGATHTNHKWWDLDISNDGRIMLASSDGDALIHASFDYGQTWQLLENLLGDNDANMRWRGVAVSGDSSRVVLCRNGSGAPFDIYSVDLSPGATTITSSDLAQISFSGVTNDLCGAIDLDESGNTLIAGSFWSNWVGVFKNENSTWTQILSNDFSVSGVNYVQTSDDGNTLLVTFYESLNTAISQDSGKTWVRYTPSGDAGSIAAMSPNGELLFSGDYTDGFFKVALSGERRTFASGEEFKALDYYSDLLMTMFSPTSSAAVAVSTSGVTGASAEGGDWDLETGADWAIYPYGCELYRVDPESGAHQTVSTLSSQLMNLNSDQCWGFTIGRNSVGYVAKGSRIYAVDLLTEEIIGNPLEPFGLANISALAFDYATDELWLFEDYGRVAGTIDVVDGTFTLKFQPNQFVLHARSDTTLEGTQVWSADFDSSGTLWMSGYSDGTSAVIISLDPNATNPAGTVRIHGKPILTDGYQINSDAIWFRGFGNSGQQGSDSAMNNSKSIVYPVIEKITYETGGLRIKGRSLETISSLEIAGTTRKILISKPEEIIVEFSGQVSNSLEILTTGSFGRLLFLSVDVRNWQDSVPNSQSTLELRKFFKVQKQGRSFSLNMEPGILRSLAGSGQTVATCVGYFTPGKTSSSTRRIQALIRAKRVCEGLQDLNSSLTFTLEASENSALGRGVWVRVLQR